MEALFSWFSNLINFFGSFIPRIRICEAVQIGLKFVHGKNIKLIEPGLFVYWPIVTNYRLYPSVMQYDNLVSQVIYASDGKTYLCDGCVAYKIVDVIQYATQNEEPTQGIQQLVLTAIREILTESSPSIINRAEFDNKLTAKCIANLEPRFGIEIDYAKLVSFAPAKVINLSGGLDSTASTYITNNV